MNNFKTVIGIEVHAVVKSKTKMFSASVSNHNAEPNTNINAVDVALPGTLPSPNELVVKKAIALAFALHMSIARMLTFDRKNYFYIDLPKGFQITQQNHPIGTNGYIEITKKDGTKKRIGIERIHIEEDTAKQVKVGNKVYLDYNRCGMPLIEIVSRPHMNDAEEAALYLTELKRILNFCGDISDAKLEEGSMRADINISVCPQGSVRFGTRAEIKNINSISNVVKAIKYETARQIELALAGKKWQQETRRYDEATQTTIFLRPKINYYEYHFIPEANILRFDLTEQFIDDSISLVKHTVQDVINELKELKVPDKLIEQLLDDYPLYQVFEKVLSKVKDASLAITWIMVELVGLLKKDNKKIEQIESEKIDNIIEMLGLLETKKINSKQAKTIIEKIYKTNAKAQQIIDELGFKQITDEKEIEKLLKPIVDNNPKMTAQYKDRPERVEKMLLGLLMKETNGQANPVISAKILRKLLEK